MELTRRGEPVAVLIGRRQYARMIAKRRRFSDALAAFVQDFDLVALEINPEEVFSGARDQTGGREIRL